MKFVYTFFFSSKYNDAMKTNIMQTNDIIQSEHKEGQRRAKELILSLVAHHNLPL